MGRNSGHSVTQSLRTKHHKAAPFLHRPQPKQIVTKRLTRWSACRTLPYFNPFAITCKTLPFFNPSTINSAPLSPIPFPFCSTRVRASSRHIEREQNHQVQRVQLPQCPLLKALQQRQQLVLVEVATFKVDPLAIRCKDTATKNNCAPPQHRPHKLKHAVCATRNHVRRRDRQLAPTLARNARTPVPAVERHMNETSADAHER